MANPNAPHGLQPTGYTNATSWAGKANLYHIQSTDTLAYYVGDIMRLVPNAGANSSTVGADVLGVPNVTGWAAGTQAAATIVGSIVGIQSAPIGVGTPGAGQNNAVNLNIQYVPATKANDYYVWIADDPNTEFEIQLDSTNTLTAATLIGMNAAFTQAAPATVNGPLSGTVILGTGTPPATTSTLPLHIVRLPYRPNITAFGAFCPLIVRINTHQYANAATGV